MKRIWIILIALLLSVSFAKAQSPVKLAIPTSAANTNSTVIWSGNPLPVTISGGSGGAVTIADGADVAQGATTDAVCATATGTCTEIALLKYLNSQISNPIPAGSNIIGKVGIDQTTPGTTNAVSATGAGASGATASGNPVGIAGIYKTTPLTLTDGQRGDVLLDTRQKQGVYLGIVNTTTALGTSASPAIGASIPAYLPTFGSPALQVTSTTFDPQFSCNQSAIVNVTAANTTEIVALTASQIIRVCSFSVSISLTGSIQFMYGTGTNCGTGTNNLTGDVPVLTGTPWGLSGGPNSLFRTASANALCVKATTGNAIGFVTYAKF